MSRFLIISVCFLLYACSEKVTKKTVITEFNKTGELISEGYKMPPILVPRAMFIADNKLFIYKEREDKLFEIFTLPDLNYISAAGNRGQGPNDFIMLDTRSFQGTDYGFTVMEAGSSIHKTVVFENNQLIVSKTDKFYGLPNNGFYPLADSVYLTLGRAGGSMEYCLYDRKTDLLTEVGSYPQWTTMDINDREAPPLIFTYLKNCVAHPDGKKFATFYGKFKRLRIYNDSVNVLHDIEVRIPPYKSNVEENPKEQWIYYVGTPQVLGDYIYTLCYNSKGSNLDGVNNSELQVWDWEGNPIAVYKLDRKISLMIINSSDRRMYALDRSKEDTIYVYNIPRIK